MPRADNVAHERAQKGRGRPRPFSLMLCPLAERNGCAFPSRPNTVTGGGCAADNVVARIERAPITVRSPSGEAQPSPLGGSMQKREGRHDLCEAFPISSAEQLMNQTLFRSCQKASRYCQQPRKSISGSQDIVGSPQDFLGSSADFVGRPVDFVGRPQDPARPPPASPIRPVFIGFRAIRSPACVDRRLQRSPFRRV
jgi:hypothetical protein